MIKHNSVRIITYSFYIIMFFFNNIFSLTQPTAKGDVCGMEQRATAIGIAQSQTAIIFLFFIFHFQL